MSFVHQSLNGQSKQSSFTQKQQCVMMVHIPSFKQQRVQIRWNLKRRAYLHVVFNVRHNNSSKSHWCPTSLIPSSSFLTQTQRKIASTPCPWLSGELSAPLGWHPTSPTITVSGKTMPYQHCLFSSNRQTHVQNQSFSSHPP